MNKKYRSGLYALLTVLVVLAAACTSAGTSTTTSAAGGGETSSTATTGGETSSTATTSGVSETLVVGTEFEPTTLDAQKTDENGLTLSTWSINEGLIDFDRDGNVVPILVTELPVIDSTDQTRWHFNLREGISFTDGSPLDAEAVKSNIERILDPDYASPLSGNLANIAAVEVIDTLTFDIVTTEPDPILPNRLRLLRIVSPTAAAGADYGENPVGTGPYLFDSWQKGVSLTLRANEDYWGEPKPQIDQIEIRFIPDANTRMSALEAGEIDIATSPPINRLEALVSSGDFKVHQTNGGESGITFIPGRLAPYSDVRFRQALNFAIDRELLVNQIFNGQFEIQTCNVVSEGTEGYVPELEGTYSYDPARAMELLAEVDIPEGFVLRFTSTEGYGSGGEVAQAMASFWEAIGLDVELSLVEVGEYVETLFNPAEREVVLYGESSKETNSITREVDTYYARGGPGNVIDDESQNLLDPLIATANSTFEAGARAEALSAVAQTICEQALQVFTFHRKDLAVMANNITYTSGFGGFTRTDFHYMSFSG